MAWHQIGNDIMTWKHLPYYWPFLRGIHWSTAYSPHEEPVLWSFDVYFVVSLDKFLICCQPGQTVEQTIKLQLIWDGMELMCHRCNGNFQNHDKPLHTYGVMLTLLHFHSQNFLRQFFQGRVPTLEQSTEWLVALRITYLLVWVVQEQYLQNYPVLAHVVPSNLPMNNITSAHNLAPFLINWIYFNPSMKKQLHPL